ncbi:MAG: acyl-CoA dehydrogenase family protein [Hyphomicrobiaceae bacterium]|nr:acyl-CoA dehydrogenase family protein [Hyphomicrobiaceae bacterium]
MKARADIRDHRTLSDVDRDYIARAERFAAQYIGPNAAAWERGRQPGLPREVVAAWAESGLLTACVPRAHGGGGASFLAKIGIVEVIARQCIVSSFALVNLLNGPLRLVQNGTEEQRARYLPGLVAGTTIIALCLTEPQSGSDFAATATRAERVDGGWRLTGRKAWVTHGTLATLGIVYAQTDPARRGKGIACFLVDLAAKECTMSAPYALEAGSVAGICDLALEGVLVSDRDVLMQPGEAFAKALGSINAARTHVAAMCCGVVGEALAIANQYARERKAFGQPLIEHQGLRWKLADIASDIEAARQLTYHAADLVEQAGDAMSAAAIAKKMAVEMAARTLPECMAILGANGLKSEYPLARHMLAARIAAFADGTNEIQKDRIGRLIVEG